MGEKIPGYRYRCPGGHWTYSHERFADGTPCEAVFGVPNSTAPVQCSGVYDEDTPCYVDADDFDATVELLTDRIRQLESAGDALAEMLQSHSCHCSMSKCRCGHDAVIDAWEEVRRG